MCRKQSFSFTETISGWKVEIPATLSVSGKRERVFFPAWEKARAYAQELGTKFMRNGNCGLSINQSIDEEAARVQEILAPTDATLTQAALAFRRQWDVKHSCKIFSRAVEAYLDSRSGVSPTTLVSYRCTLQEACRPFFPITLQDISASEVSRMLRPKGKAATHVHLPKSRSFWNLASARGWCPRRLMACFLPGQMLTRILKKSPPTCNVT